jgi:hypothetical protein
MVGPYAKAAAALIPGASRLPWVPGGGGEVPALERSREGITVDRDHLTAYARVCGFGVRDELPPTYPHVLAFPLHMSLMTDGRFPFGAVGLVHIANRIAIHRPPRAAETLDVHVRAGALEQHPKGRSFSLHTELRASGEPVWESSSTMLRRGGGGGGGDSKPSEQSEPPAFVAEWRLPGDLGRRYATVSGDRNPIHMHPLSARLFGFPRAIAHGMWTKARCLAALRLPESFTAEVEFRKPILLPGTVAFHAADGRFEVRSGDSVHLTGRLG